MADVKINFLGTEKRWTMYKNHIALSKMSLDGQRAFTVKGMLLK